MKKPTILPAPDMLQRLPETRSLSQILPTGVEGGKEFARIVDLLLFHDARRHGRTITLFSDAAGDYQGLDSFSEAFRRDGAIGYQYKFYPSPLTAKHRSEIKESLKTAIKGAKKGKRRQFSKWILVTPDDFLEPSTRKDGGDVTWFDGLRDETEAPFDLEHWGHRSLQALFLETRSLCLAYYPELALRGYEDRRSIDTIRRCYDDGLRQLYQRIEFVGMSVYKPEATRGVPMEDIYIPVSTVPNSAPPDDLGSTRVNPLQFLTRGRRQVILGDPGSGKSTLLRFLALVGCSAPLQKRCAALPDARLPVLVVLRKYAAELKKSTNLPLLDFIIDSVKADFSLTAAERDFFEYYLECGQAILLFDGLDELGTSDLKKTVRDRVLTLGTTYPGNTVIITSRIVGYEAAFGFDEKEFAHHRVGKLRNPEIIQFVEDWYRARIENNKEREENVKDLTRILTEDAHIAIQELARNPLLLTIIALVHRIDAVLPDERVVLYQKCTETLLNTWHTWKFRDADNPKRGKIERRNRQRMEAIAYWMQSRPKTTAAASRAIVKQSDLVEFLRTYIDQNELLRPEDDDPRDLAEDFIEFVRQRAGLLIEVGDAQFSFVHLTFQEYLAASWFKTQCEKDGVESIWAELRRGVSDSTWHEVTRLLVASLTSDHAQEILVKNLVRISTKTEIEPLSLLLAGLLIDGVEAAEQRRKEILGILLEACAKCSDATKYRQLTAALRSCDSHQQESRQCLDDLVSTAWKTKKRDSRRLNKTLTLMLAGRSSSEATALIAETSPTPTERIPLSFAGCEPVDTRTAGRRIKIDGLAALAMELVTISPSANLVGTSIPSVIAQFDRAGASETIFRLSAFTLLTRVSGPYHDFHRNLSSFTGLGLVNPKKLSEKAIEGRSIRSVLRELHPHNVEALFKKLPDILSERFPGRQPARTRDHAGMARKIASRRVSQILGKERSKSGTLFERALAGFSERESEIRDMWNFLIRNPDVLEKYSETICSVLSLEKQPQLVNSIAQIFLPRLPTLFPCATSAERNDLTEAFRKNTESPTQVSDAAWLLLLDIFLRLHEGIYDAVSPISGEFIQLTKEHPDPKLIFSHAMRDILAGEKESANKLKKILSKPDEPMRALLKSIYWLGSREIGLENSKADRQLTLGA